MTAQSTTTASRKRVSIVGRPLLHHLGTLEVPDPRFRQDAEAAGDFLVAFLDLAEVAAEAGLVHLLAGLAVPEPAIVRADLVGEDDPHLLVLVQPAELDLEVDQRD